MVHNELYLHLWCIKDDTGMNLGVCICLYECLLVVTAWQESRDKKHMTIQEHVDAKRLQDF